MSQLLALLALWIMRGKKLSIDEIEARLLKNGKGIQIVGDYKGMKEKALFKCLHGHQWHGNALNVISNGSGCPDCWEERRKAMNIGAVRSPELRAKIGEKVKAYLALPEVKEKRRKAYARPEVKAKMREKGGWNTPKYYLKLGYEVIWLYIIEFLFEGTLIQKVGITHDRKKRWREFGGGIQVIFSEAGSPEYICKREKEIIKASRDYYANLPKSFDGHSECFTRVIDPKFH